MKDYLKTYEMILRTVGPVFVGDGQSLLKKEYIYNKRKKTVMVPDKKRLYAGLEKRGLDKLFAEYVLTDVNAQNYRERRDLYQWLRDNNISEADYKKWIAYELDCGDFLQEKGAITIATCQKDNYGIPYIPGSSIKGMLRTILLAFKAAELSDDILKTNDIKREVEGSRSRRSLLQREVKQLENDVFHTLQRKDAKGIAVKMTDAVNDCLSGLIVSDSEPISLNNMVLCQKIDENIEGQKHALNILRESVKPATDIRFKLTIDTQTCPFDLDYLLKAVEEFSSSYYEEFLIRFKGEEKPASNAVWLGGGSGFFTKTVVYPCIGGRDAVDVVSEIIDATLPNKIKNQHHHYKDIRLGVSPHVVKRTRYQGKEYRMGECLILQG